MHPPASPADLIRVARIDGTAEEHVTWEDAVDAVVGAVEVGRSSFA